MKSSQKWFFSKMFRVSQASMMAMSLSYYSGKLTKWGTMHNGDISELQVSVRHTGENAGSALYVTPTASDANPRKPSPNAEIYKTETGTIRVRNPNGTSSNLGLANNLALYPSPVASDATTGALYRQSKTTGTRFGMNLTQYVAMEAGKNWITPIATDYKGSGGKGSVSYDKYNGDYPKLCGQVIEDEQPKPRQLNPDWVDLLQGYPIGYTDLDIEDITVGLEGHQFPAYRNQEQHDFEPPRVTDRKDQRRDRVKALGNAVVPQCVLPIAQAMFDELTTNSNYSLGNS